jgi:hypothetical protein
MKTYKAILYAGFFLVLFSCNGKQDSAATEKKTIKEVEYQTVQQGQGEKVEMGNWLKLQVVQTYYDSVLHDTRHDGADYTKYDTATMTKESMVTFKDARVGDSLEFKVPVSALKNKPAFANKGGYFITRVKVEKIFHTEQDYKTYKPANDSLYKLNY